MFDEYPTSTQKATTSTRSSQFKSEQGGEQQEGGPRFASSGAAASKSVRIAVPHGCDELPLTSSCDECRYMYNM